jgi:hypothetical protein
MTYVHGDMGSSSISSLLESDVTSEMDPFDFSVYMDQVRRLVRVELSLVWLMRNALRHR